MALTFEEKQRNYVQLLVEQGVNLQPEQQLQINIEPGDIALGELAAELAYRRGAKYVDLTLSSPRRDALQIAHAAPRHRNFIPGYVTVRSDQIVDTKGAILSFRSSSEPDLFATLDQRHVADFQAAAYEMRKRLATEGITAMGINWCLAGPPSRKWAQKVFPGVDPDEAVSKLWDDIFAMTFADQPDCLVRWRNHLDQLGRRAEKLSSLQIKELHFTGPGTDLVVGLSEKATFVAGRKSTPAGIPFCPNVPTFEAYTTPDWRRTNGKARITRPAIINGVKVIDLEVTFKEGEIVATSAAKNVDTYNALIATDPGAKRLGEIALVGIDSPIFRTGRVFESTLYDENAACHFATGRAYEVGLIGGRQMSPTELAEHGYNHSKTHQDVMISNEEVSVHAITYSGKEIPLLERGSWKPEFLDPRSP
jgi:aminopeptidase